MKNAGSTPFCHRPSNYIHEWAVPCCHRHPSAIYTCSIITSKPRSYRSLVVAFHTSTLKLLPRTPPQNGGNPIFRRPESETAVPRTAPLFGARHDRSQTFQHRWPGETAHPKFHQESYCQGKMALPSSTIKNCQGIQAL